MRIAVTGATGLVGYPIARHLAALGHQVVTLGRAPVPGLDHMPWQLGERPPLAGLDGLVHAAFAHVPGRYRGGEGEDPAGFRDRNLAGTLALFQTARAAGVRVVFTSSRAVYGSYPPGTPLDEALPPRPDTLYGEVKLRAEQALGDGGVSLRITGVHGPPVPGRAHKWRDLFDRFDRGEVLRPHVATEVHAEDVAEAVVLVLRNPPEDQVLNVSDFVLDRRDLLATYAGITGRSGVLPAPGDASGLNVMSTDRLGRLGWRPRGPDGLAGTLRALLAGG